MKREASALSDSLHRRPAAPDPVLGAQPRAGRESAAIDVGRIGAHLLLDAWGAPFDVLDAPARVREALQATAAAGGLTLLRVVLEHFEPQGVSAVGLLAESHLAIHTWPERSAFAADLFHCGSLPVEAVVGELVTRLEATASTHCVVQRAARRPHRRLQIHRPR